MKLERIAKYDNGRLSPLKMYSTAAQLMDALQSQTKHFRFSLLGLKRYQQQLYYTIMNWSNL